MNNEPARNLTINSAAKPFTTNHFVATDKEGVVYTFTNACDKWCITKWGNLFTGNENTKIAIDLTLEEAKAMYKLLLGSWEE